MPKQSIRSTMLARRRRMLAEDRAVLSRAVQARFLRTPEFLAASTLALYSPVHNEVLTEDVFHAASERGKRLAYPRVGATGLEFVEVAALVEFQRGRFGLLEPTGHRVLPVDALDLMVVPGVAYDLAGFRLGYGKGFYDRFLHDAARCPQLIGFCFEQQLVDALPVETHDIAMHLLITETRILRF